MSGRIRQLAARDPVVLVVDDQRSNLDLVAAVLRNNGYAVDEALGGDAALAAVATRVPDLVLLDMLMPGVDGFAVACALRDSPPTADVPVIFVTAAAERQHAAARDADAGVGNDDAADHLAGEALVQAEQRQEQAAGEGAAEALAVLRAARDEHVVEPREVEVGDRGEGQAPSPHTGTSTFFTTAAMRRSGEVPP